MSEKEQIRPFNTPISLHAPVVYFALTGPTTTAVDILCFYIYIYISTTRDQVENQNHCVLHFIAAY